METERAIRQYRPSVTLFIGLAGGLKDVSVGDVVASTKLYGYESGKENADTFELRPNVAQASYGLEQRARAEARKGDWRKRLDENMRATTLRALVGPIAAGERIVGVTGSNTASFLRRNYGDALAVEMEGRGFIEAVRANQRVEAIVIRGISNLLADKQL
jgi:nucleoside phosphorylase